MNTYTAITDFTIKPQNIAVSVGDTLAKYGNSVGVTVKTLTLTEISFWNWVGSESSLLLMSLTSTSEDPMNPGTLTPIDINSNFKTTDIVNTLNAVVNHINAG